MPKKILPDMEAFQFHIKHKLESWGFRSINKIEIEKDFKRLGLFSRNPKEGREEGFIFTSKNGLKVIVWTTFILQDEKARDEDLGWVLITNGDKVLYFAHPFRRTKNFAANLTRYAWIARWRVLNRPLCPDCNRLMDIARGKGIRARYWICTNRTKHKSAKATKISWDYGMPPKALSFLKAERAARRKYIVRRRKDGKLANVAPLIRSGMWTVSRKDNMV